jgi:glucose-6-phosphate 1-epimerase
MIVDLNALNRQHGIPGQVQFKSGPGGLTVAEVGNPAGSATIALQGAHVMTWAPAGEHPVIWLSPFAKFAPGKSIRGGVPVCWPWFGPHPKEPTFPGHGYARTVPWEVVKTESLAGAATRLTFRLLVSDATRVQWPHATELTLVATVGRTLAIDLVTRNNGLAPVTVGDALHTYFEVGDVRNVGITGLEGCSYLDKVDGGKRKTQTGVVTIAGEVDRIYLGSTADCLINDPDHKRRIRVSKRGSRSTVVWNPWTEKAAKMGDFGEDGYLKMVCVESTNAAEDVVSVAPGGSHTLAVVYGVECLE